MWEEILGINMIFVGANMIFFKNVSAFAPMLTTPLNIPKRTAMKRLDKIGNLYECRHQIQTFLERVFAHSKMLYLDESLPKEYCNPHFQNS